MRCGPKKPQKSYLKHNLSFGPPKWPHKAPNGPPIGHQNRTKSQKRHLQKPLGKHLSKRHQKTSQTDPPETLKIKLPHWSEHDFHIFRESLKRPPNDPPNASIWEAFGHQNLKKYPQEGLPKNTQKKNAQKLPDCPTMTPKWGETFAVLGLFFHSWPPLGAQLAPNASQRASQEAF